MVKFQCSCIDVCPDDRGIIRPFYFRQMRKIKFVLGEKMQTVIVSEEIYWKWLTFFRERCNVVNDQYSPRKAGPVPSAKDFTDTLTPEEKRSVKVIPNDEPKVIKHNRWFYIKGGWTMDLND